MWEKQNMGKAWPAAAALQAQERSMGLSPIAPGNPCMVTACLSCATILVLVQSAPAAAAKLRVGVGGCSCRALGWERHNLAWKLSSLQGMGVSPRSHAALTREQDLNTAETISPDQLNLAALNHPQARYIQIYTRLTVYYI